MASGRSQKKKKAADRRIGLILLLLGFAFVACLSAGVWWIKKNQIVDDEVTLCPESGPSSVHVLLFDQSDPITPQQALAIRQRVNAIKDAAKPGYRFDVYSFSGDAINVLSPILSICRPGRKEDANEIYQNPEEFRRKYEEKFSPVLDGVVASLVGQPNRNNSPILESLKAAALWSFGPFDGQKVRLRVTMISDMVQHTSLLSHFRSEPNFSALEKSPAWPSLRPNLKGADVDIIYLNRPDARRGNSQVQNQGHQLYWERLISASGGRLTSSEPL